MAGLLTEEEFAHVMRFCRHFVLDDCPPCFNLRTFLLWLLSRHYPDTARKIEGLNARQIESLCIEIARRQAALRWGRERRPVSRATPRRSS
jgi:hypothetical protein